jgi:glycosyltransferase involved in cell wall biosynthesis
MTKVSVVIPCFNAGRYLRETLNSVTSQTLKPAEIIVVDDGSTDNTADIAQEYVPIVTLVQQKNQGISISRNRGMDEAKGDWIAFLDADDIWESNKLDLQLNAVYKNIDVVCVHSNFYKFGENIKSNIINQIPEVVLQNDYRIETLVTTCMVLPSTAMVRSDIPLRFYSWVDKGEDMIYFAELSNYGKFLYIPKPLVGYRQHTHQATKKKDAWVAHFKNMFRWLTEIEQQLGPKRTDELIDLLSQDIIRILKDARWSHQWERYKSLRKYAKKIEWPRGKPKILYYPEIFYQIKDIIDKIVPKTFYRFYSKQISKFKFFND